MERLTIQEAYDYHSYPELKDKANWKQFTNEKTRHIERLTEYRGKRIKVLSVDNLKMWYSPEDMIIKLTAEVQIRESFYP